MARGLESAVDTAVQGSKVRPIILVKIDTTGGFFRAWTGYGNLTFNSEVYIGVGDLGAVTEFTESRDLQANGVTLTISGVPASNVSLALSQIQQGKDATVFLGFLDATTKALLVDPYEIFTGETDIPTISHGAEASTIGIKCENRMITLNKPRIRRYTPEDQAIDDATDEGFDFVAALQDAQVTFGPNANSTAVAFIEAQ